MKREDEIFQGSKYSWGANLVFASVWSVTKFVSFKRYVCDCHIFKEPIQLEMKVTLKCLLHIFPGPAALNASPTNEFTFYLNRLQKKKHQPHQQQ